MDDPQFKILYNEFKNQVYNLALSFLYNPDDAQDAT